MKTIVRIVAPRVAALLVSGSASRRAIPHEAGEDRRSVPFPARRRHLHRRRLIAQRLSERLRAAVPTIENIGRRLRQSSALPMRAVFARDGYTPAGFASIEASSSTPVSKQQDTIRCG